MNRYYIQNTVLLLMLCEANAISAKHQFFCPAVISVIIISEDLLIVKLLTSLKMLCSAHAMASEAEYFTIGCMI